MFKIITGFLSAAAALLLAAVLILTDLFSGGTERLAVDNADGTELIIEWDNPGALTRAPHYSHNTGVITMNLNGRDWFSLQPLSAEEAQECADSGILCAESSNLKAYDLASEGEEPVYVYILDLEGTDEAFIRFDTSEGPDEPVSNSRAFSDFITYCVDGEPTVPDVDGLQLCRAL